MADIVAARVIIPVSTNADGATKKVKNLDKSMKKTAKSAKLLKSALKFIGFSLLISGFRKLVRVTEQQQKAEAQLNAVLKSTGGIAGVTSKELISMAAGLQKVTAFGDEAILQGQALLLTFTKIGKDVFPQATETILNMSTAMGTDLKSSAIQVGKALNDPIMGVTALRRVGVQLTESQEDMIKQFVATGQIAKAQAVILGELETQFGGVARAASKTLGGSLSQLGNSLGDVIEQVGNELTPAVSSLSRAFIDLTRDGSIFVMFLKGLGKVLALTIKGVSNVVDAFNFASGKLKLGAINTSLEQNEKVFKRLANTIEKEYGEKAKAAGVGVIKILEDSAAAGDKTAASLLGHFNAVSEVNEKLRRESSSGAKDQIAIADRVNESLTAEVDKVTALAGSYQASATSAKGAGDAYSQALEALAGAGDVTAQLDLLNQKFAEQLAVVNKAGLDATVLEKFYQNQRKAQLSAFFEESAMMRGASFEERQSALNLAYEELLASDKLSYESRIAAQAAYVEKSKELEQSRFAKINATAQLIGGIANQTIALGQKVTEFQNAQIESQIEKMKERGASEEEIEKKRKKLARKQAKDQKKFAIFSAIVNTALGVTNALSTLPPPASYIAAALTAAIGIAEIAVISAQPLPGGQFGLEGIVPPGNEADSGLVRVNQGEKINVTPSRFSGQGGDSSGSKIAKLVVGEREMDAYVTDTVNKGFSSGKIQINRKGAIRTA